MCYCFFCVWGENRVDVYVVCHFIRSSLNGLSVAISSSFTFTLEVALFLFCFVCRESYFLWLVFLKLMLPTISIHCCRLLFSSESPHCFFQLTIPPAAVALMLPRLQTERSSARQLRQWFSASDSHGNHQWRRNPNAWVLLLRFWFNGSELKSGH